MRHAVRELRNSGYTSRDTGILLGVSNQRISRSSDTLRSGERRRPSQIDLVWLGYYFR
jgi:hypothetical protein